MKNRCLLFILFLLIAACGNKMRKEYYPSGELLAEYSIQDTVRNGVYKKYYKDGRLMEEGAYKNGLLNGMRKAYHNNRRVKWEINYINGKQEGSYKEYTMHGILVVSTGFRNGKQHGITQIFYANGILKSTARYEDGLCQGEFREYFDNGKEMAYGLFKDNKSLYLEEKDERGKYVDIYRYIEITPPEITMTTKDTYTGLIKIHGPSPEKVIIYAGILDTIVEETGNMEFVHLKDNGTITCEFKPRKTGVYYLNVHLRNTNLPGKLYTKTSKILVAE